ncbi:hypothetical protein [Sphingomonas panacis]|nr:hypothetical protein [Sphingomonas panacis]
MPISATRVGAWQCDLATERLLWSDGVYDLFDLPRGSPVDREMAVDLYDPDSRAEMERLRARAIRDRTGFSVDALIWSAVGVDRWIRITARVECDRGRPVRLCGSKQDVTLEHLLWGGARAVAEGRYC